MRVIELKIGKIAWTMFLISALLCVAIRYCECQGQPFRYESHGRRDPFVPLAGQEKPGLLKLEDIDSIDDIRLEGIASDTKGRKVVIINGELLKENTKIGNIKIIAITNKYVALTIEGKPYELKFPEEGGGKGEDQDF